MQPTRAFVTLVLCVLAVLVLAPIIYMFTVPFVEGGTGAISGILAIFDSRQLSLARSSFLLATGVTLLSLLFGLPFAFLVERTDLIGWRILQVLAVIPLLIPSYIHAIAWNYLNPLLTGWGMPDIHNLGGAIWVQTLSFFPIVTILAVSGLKSVDRNQEEAGILAFGKWQTLMKITLPLVRPHILSGAVFVFVFALVDFGVPDILRVKVYPVEIFIQFSAFYDERAAMLLSLPLICVAIFLLLLQKWSMSNRIYVQTSGGISQAGRFRMGRWLQIPTFFFCCTVIFLSVGLQLLVLMKMAGPFATYIQIFRSSWQQLSYSLILAGSGAFFTLIFAFFLSYLVEQTNVRGKRGLEFSSYLPLAIPAVALGIGLIKIWNRPGIDLIYGSSCIIIVGYVAHYLPFSFITLSSGLKQLNSHLVEAAWLSSSKRICIVKKIILPLLMPSLITAYFIVFMLALGDLGTTLLIIPPGRETVPIKIYNLMHYGAEQKVASLCLILVGIILFFATLLFFGYKRVIRHPA